MLDISDFIIKIRKIGTKKLVYISKVEKGPIGSKAVAVADKIHNLESLCWAYSEQGIVLISSKFRENQPNKIINRALTFLYI